MVFRLSTPVKTHEACRIGAGRYIRRRSLARSQSQVRSRRDTLIIAIAIESTTHTRPGPGHIATIALDMKTNHVLIDTNANMNTGIGIARTMCTLSTRNGRRASSRSRRRWF